MVYVLWDTETNNLVAEYDNLVDALELVLLGIERNGDKDTEALSLEFENVLGKVSLVATGHTLADLARQERQ